MRIPVHSGWAYELIPTNNTQILAVDAMLEKL
jgi:hypothetical protein